MNHKRKQNNEHNTSVIYIPNWIKKNKKNQSNKNFTEYLKLLSFNELIYETKIMIEELKSKPLNEDLTQRTSLLLKEFNHRLGLNSKIFSDSLEKIYAQTE